MWKTAPRHFLTETYKQSALKHPPQLVQVASLADDLNQVSLVQVLIEHPQESLSLHCYSGRTVTIKLILFKWTSASIPLVTSPRARGVESGVSVSSGPFGPRIKWISMKQALIHSRSSDELEWGKENCIQIKRIREVAELFEDLKNRVSQFNTHISETSSPSDYTSARTQKFIVQ
ncbi:hypothetical protein AMELA_G00184670 [Ameiurus melas]|uniref:Uncharacterized protein n=1 Tax=Ameiurus melas TaxID=219545 RepID=A0A7J6ADU6_AMEME|nr:hypothetical protein AMELA_G00184670 [Ameiurus melas]